MSAWYRIIFVPGSRRSKHMLQCASLGIGALRGVRFGFLLGDDGLPPKYARARPKWARLCLCLRTLCTDLTSPSGHALVGAGCSRQGAFFLQHRLPVFLRRHNRAIERGPVGAIFFWNPYPSRLAKFPWAVETLANWSTLSPHKKESICTQRGSNPRPCR